MRSFLGAVTLLVTPQIVIGQTISVDGVAVAQYVAPALLDVATGQLYATPSSAVTLQCTGISSTPLPGPFVRLGPHYIPVPGSATTIPGVFNIDGVLYEAGPSPVEIDTNGFTVIPDPGFTNCRRSNGQPLPATSAVVFYGPNSEVMFLSLAVPVRYDTGVSPHQLVMTSSSGDAVCTPITPPAVWLGFDDGFENQP